MDGERIPTIVHEIGERLEGDWLILGGGLAIEDVDVVGIAGADDPRHALLQLAHDLGLPVEALNSAADFFVHRIDGWQEEVELFHRGSKGRVFRPSATLFLLLKLRRLSRQDLSDCILLLEKAERDGLSLDRARVLAALDALTATGDDELVARRAQLRGLLAS